MKSSRTVPNSNDNDDINARSTWVDAGGVAGGADVVVDVHLQLGQQHVHHGHLALVPPSRLPARADDRGTGRWATRGHNSIDNDDYGDDDNGDNDNDDK